MYDGTAADSPFGVLDWPEREALELQAVQDSAGWPELPDVIPDWVLEDRPLPEPPTCDCGCACLLEVPAALASAPEDEAGWAIPGVTGLGGAEPASLSVSVSSVLPPVSAAVTALQAALASLVGVVPTSLPEPQAVVDSAALLAAEQQLRLLNLHRIADVQARGLHQEVGFRSARSWLLEHRPDGHVTDVTLGVQLRDYPGLQAAVQAQQVSLVGARACLKGLRAVARHLDRADGLIDGQPAAQVLPAVVKHALSLICRWHGGLHDTDPRLQPLIDRATTILHAWGPGGSQLALVEAVLVWLAEELPARELAGPIDEIVLSLVPSVLEERAERARARRSLELTRDPDGHGGQLEASRLSPECYELLWTALKAEAARDPRNSTDTAAWADLSEQDKAQWGLHATDDDLTLTSGQLLAPRLRRERLHDALQRLLTRYLEHGLGGTAGGVPVQIHITLTEPALTGQPGAPPARGDSGQLLPRHLLRRWWCDASITSYVLSLGGKALRASHTQRTLTALERRALHAEGGNTCAGDGCCTGQPDPLVGIRPHHILGYAEDQITNLNDTLPVCDTLHHDLHTGHKTVRLKNGRYLNEHGYTNPPDPFSGPAPPF